MQLALVTYMWGAEWDIPTIVKNCRATGFAGVELRSGHKHGVEPAMSKAARSEVADRFTDSGVTLVGLGSACEYHATDRKTLQKNIDETKAFIELSHDVGGSGVKVRPNGLPKDVPEENTLQQIAKALGEVAQFGAGYGQEIRLEVHGRDTSSLDRIRRIMEFAAHDNARVCWNSNPEDLEGRGTGAQLQAGREVPGAHGAHPRPDFQLPLARAFFPFERCQVRRMDAVGRRPAHSRSHPRDEILPARLGNVGGMTPKRLPMRDTDVRLTRITICSRIRF